jgi:glutamate-1-semialdehyde 2,1-aminomutase
MRAGLAALAKMERLDGWRELDRRTSAFCSALAAGFASLRTPLDIVRVGSIFWIVQHSGAAVRRPDRIPAGNSGWFGRFFHAAVERGVYLAPSAHEVGFVSMAHTDEVLAQAADALIAAAREADAA